MALAVGLGGNADAMYINYATKELYFKVAYFGTPSSGSLDSFFALYSRVKASRTKGLDCGAIESGATACLFEVGLGDLRGYRTRFHVAALESKSPTEAEDRFLLRGADVVVFTAAENETIESSSARLQALRSLVEQTPVVVQVRGQNDRNVLEKLAKAFGVTSSEIKSIRSAMSRQQALSGADPDEEEGVVVAFKAAAKHAMMSARDGVQRPVAELFPGERYAKVGKYKILVPELWKDFKTIEAPPSFLFHGTVGRVYFEVTFTEGGSEDPSALLRRYSQPFRAEKTESATVKMAGMPFVGAKLSRLETEKLRDASVELYAGKVGRDTVVFEVALLDGTATPDLRRLCFSMVDSAIIRRMNEDPSPWTGHQNVPAKQ